LEDAAKKLLCDAGKKKKPESFMKLGGLNRGAMPTLGSEDHLRKKLAGGIWGKKGILSKGNSKAGGIVSSLKKIVKKSCLLGQV